MNHADDSPDVCGSTRLALEGRPRPAHSLGSRWRRRHARRYGDYRLGRLARVRCSRSTTQKAIDFGMITDFAGQSIGVFNEHLPLPPCGPSIGHPALADSDHCRPGARRIAHRKGIDRRIALGRLRDSHASRKFTSKSPGSGTSRPHENTLIVTHFPNISEAYPQDAVGLADGEALILHPDGRGGATIVARVKIDEWAGLVTAR
jgi:hypothetical protein